MTKSRHTGMAIVLAWPETYCKQAGAWYDSLMKWLGINKNGYYKVGHAAIVLVDCESTECHYFDFGRYHAPAGYGRVRNRETDLDLKIRTTPIVESNRLVNLDEIIEELSKNESCHGDGKIYASVSQINFEQSYKYAISEQEKVFQKYGPFVVSGTNCSRFVRNVVSKGKPSILENIRLKLPRTLTPSPMTNVRALKYN